MNKDIEQLFLISQKEKRNIIGLMSGTSLDGLDIALCTLSGRGSFTSVEVAAFETFSYEASFQKKLRAICFVKQVDLEQVCLLNTYLGKLYSSMVNDFLFSHHLSSHEIDLIASHGQTLYHSPARLRKDDDGNSTLQIGDADQIATLTGIITVSDFRQKHIAQGKEGAPLALFGDYLLFKSEVEHRILLNIGGIANFTIVRAKASFKEVISTDAGPGNTLMDQYVQKYFKGEFYDKDAQIAVQGVVDKNLLEALLKHSFFDEAFPKTTGPEVFNLQYLENAQKSSSTEHLNRFDVVATLNKFSASSIANAIKYFFNKDESPVIYVSGGGGDNPSLVLNLQALTSFQIKNIRDLGMHPGAKEAVLFALLANETVAGDYSLLDPNLKSLGKISLPH